MAYRKGDLQIITEESIRIDYGLELDENPADYISDSRANCPGLPIVALPHSCDRWIIGGVEEVRQLLQDLTEALKTIQNQGVGNE